MDGTEQTVPYDLCVIGGGISGLNALYTASQYLPQGARVALVDANAAAGGMWTQSYDYVRLHQPHEMFTVGDMRWDWHKPRSYLAKRDEVSGHLQACLAAIRPKLALTELFGHRLTDAQEVATPDGHGVAITCEGPDGPVHLQAAKMIDARGLNVPQADPMALSSDAVVSTTPNALRSLPVDDAPVFVVGGGKTGMDTVLAALELAKGRPVTLINGKGTAFVNRDLFFPEGSRRHWGGHLSAMALKNIAVDFDGDNEDAAFKRFADVCTVNPGGGGQQFLYGLLSCAERDRIADGVAEIIPDYLADVIDTAEGPQMVMRSGVQRPVPEGAVFVNCAGQIFLHDVEPLPVLSPHGTILRVTRRDSIHFLSSVCSYFLSHLFFIGNLRRVPLTLLDLHALFRTDRRLFHMATATQAHLNTLHLLDAVPFKVADRCGLDLDRWYPLHRRLIALISLKANRARDIAHCTKTLERVAERTGVSLRLMTEVT